MSNYNRRQYALILLLTFACSSEIKFDKALWNEKHEVDFPSAFRERMVTDLTTNHKLIGLRHNELVELIGEPDFGDSTSLGYSLKVEFGFDIDPIYTKNLVFTFSADSIIASYQIKEWKKEK